MPRSLHHTPSKLAHLTILQELKPFVQVFVVGDDQTHYDVAVTVHVLGGGVKSNVRAKHEWTLMQKKTEISVACATPKSVMIISGSFRVHT